MFSKRQRRQRAVVAGLATLAVLFGAFALITQLFDTTLQPAIYDKAIDISPATVKNQITIVAVATTSQIRVTTAAVAGFH